MNRIENSLWGANRVAVIHVKPGCSSKQCQQCIQGEEYLPRPFFGPSLGPAALLRWAEPGAPPPFSPAALREARDAQHWRAACYGSLESDGRSAARPCFRALNRRSKTPNVHDLVPQALLDAAAGDAEGAADALERALESDARAAAALLAKAADALARP